VETEEEKEDYDYQNEGKALYDKNLFDPEDLDEDVVFD